MAEAHTSDVLGEARSQLAIAEKPVRVFRRAHPRAEVNLIDRDRGLEPLPLAALGHPARIVPLIGKVPDDRRGLGRAFVVEGKGVRPFTAVAVEARSDVVLI